ncbi:MAG: hypothetical protein ABJA70_08555 [Chryseolinea sp.]
MKPTPMMALPIATLMMLLSATFVRLPGTADGPYPQDLSKHKPVDATEHRELNPNSKFGMSSDLDERTVLTSSDIRWTALSMDLLECWSASSLYRDTIRLGSHSGFGERGSTIQYSKIGKNRNAAKQTAYERLLRSKHLARR